MKKILIIILNPILYLTEKILFKIGKFFDKYLKWHSCAILGNVIEKMITIKTLNKNNAEMKIEQGTPHTTILLGIEMLIETLIEDSSANLNIDYILKELKRIYERDNPNAKI